MVISPIVGVYIPIIRIPIKGGMTIPNIATFDHGTCVFDMTLTPAGDVLKVQHFLGFPSDGRLMVDLLKMCC